MGVKIEEIKDLMERMEQINLPPKEIIELENKVIRLVEERGVAGNPYAPQINEIYYFVEQYCHSLSPLFKERSIKIPKELTEKINFIKNLEIKVTIENTRDKSIFNNTGGGEATFNLVDDTIIDGKLNSGKISLFAYAYKGSIIGRTFYNSLYHEINHYYEAYNDLMKNGYYKRYKNQLIKSNVISNIFSDPNYNNLFNLILYRLFSETEFNALVASVYGDLEGFHSKRENFHEDIKKTQAYYIYQLISKNFRDLYKQINDENIKDIKDIFNIYNIHLNPYGNSTETFKKELSRKTKFLLNQLIKNIGRTASLYYDNQETTIPPETITIK